MDHRTEEQLAEILWNYNHLGMPLEKADVIIVLCSHDIQVADRGAQLYYEGWAPFIVMTGGQGELTAKMFDRPEAELIVTSPQTSFQEYKSAEVSREEMIHIIVGDTQRIKLYPEMGFQIPQEIPDEVWQAYEELVRRGYSNRLIGG